MQKFTDVLLISAELMQALGEYYLNLQKKEKLND
jgi:hypothetical protein